MRAAVTGLILLVSLLLGAVYAPGVAFIIAAFVAAAALLGLYAEPVKEVVRCIFYPEQLLGEVVGVLNRYLAAANEWLRGARAAEVCESDEQLACRVLGVVIHLIALVLFLYSDMYLVLEIMRLFSLSQAHGSWALPLLDPELAVTICLVAGPAFWGTVWTDLIDKTSFAPWAKLSPERQAMLLRTTKVIIALFVSLLVVLAAYRAIVITAPGPVSMANPVDSYAGGDLEQLRALVDEPIVETAPESMEVGRAARLIQLFVQPTVALLVTVSAIAAAWSIYGPLFLVMLLLVKLSCVLVWLLGTAVEFIRRLLLWAGNLAMDLLEFTEAIGTELLRPLGGPAQAGHRAPPGAPAEVDDVEIQQDAAPDHRPQDLPGVDEARPGRDHNWNPYA